MAGLIVSFGDCRSFGNRRRFPWAAQRTYWHGGNCIAVEDHFRIASHPNNRAIVRQYRRRCWRCLNYILEADFNRRHPSVG